MAAIVGLMCCYLLHHAGLSVPDRAKKDLSSCNIAMILSSSRFHSSTGHPTIRCTPVAQKCHMAMAVRHAGTMWGPRSIAKLVQITPISLWFMVLITIVTGAYKPTNITGGPVIPLQSVRSPWVDRAGHSRHLRHSHISLSYPLISFIWFLFAVAPSWHDWLHS